MRIHLSGLPHMMVPVLSSSCLHPPPHPPPRAPHFFLLSEWKLFSPHVLPLARFLQHIGARRAATAVALPSAIVPPRVPPPWPQLAPKPPFVFGVLDQLMRSCRNVALFWGGVAFGGPGSGSDEGWLNRLSIDGERSLALMSAIAVHSLDPTRDIPLSAEEEACTRMMREGSGSEVQTYSIRSGDADVVREKTDGGDSTACSDPTDAAATPLTRAQSSAVASARAELGAAFGPLTAQALGLAVLVVEARYGSCLAAAESLGVSAGRVRVFSVKAGHASATGGTQQEGRPEGDVVDVELPNRLLHTAAEAAPLVLNAFRMTAVGQRTDSGSGAGRVPA
jgi:hypothetical protein